MFLLAVLYGAYELVISPDKKRPVSKPDKVIESPQAPLVAPLTTATRPGPGRSSITQEMVKNLSWGRDPFVFPYGVQPYKKVKGMPMPLKLNSVLISGEQKVATVNRVPFVVSVGDWIGNEQVLAIEPDRIVLGKKGSKRKLLLESLKLTPIKIQRIR